jgi:hypothetical protein
MTMNEIDNVPLDSVRINGSTQSRVELNQATIAEYAESIRLGVDLPPVVMFFDGVNFWLADGFHRYHAHCQAGAIEIAADVRTGTQRDAVLFSVGANASHGLRRTNDDKRKAVETLLRDPEWTSWSNNAIAKACAVNDKTVAGYRAEYLRKSEDRAATPPTRTVERNGTTYEQNTAKIGKTQAPTVTQQAPIVTATIEPVAAAAPMSSAPELPNASVAVRSSETIDDAPALLSEVEQLREQVAELADSLKSTLADNEMMGRVFDADDRLKAAMDEAARQKAIAENAERTLTAKSGEFIERARAVTYWKNRAEKAEKRLATLEKAA